VEAHAKSAPQSEQAGGTVQVSPSRDRSRLVGICPRCGHPLSLALAGDGSHRKTVCCAACRGRYRVESGAAARPALLWGFGISYAVMGDWDASALMEELFDTVGPIEYVQGGFLCQPEEDAASSPTIMVDGQSRLIRFGLVGPYEEQEATPVIQQAAAEFGARFRLDLFPVAFDRWEYQDDASGFALVERRPLARLFRDPTRRTAHA
jgi:hypothetical protein